MKRADLRKARRLVVKVGTSLLTSAEGAIHAARFGQLARQVAELRGEGREVVLVSSGAVGLGLHRLGLDERPNAIPDVQAAAAEGAVLSRRLDQAGAGSGVAQQVVRLLRPDLLKGDDVEIQLREPRADRLHSLGEALGKGLRQPPDVQRRNSDSHGSFAGNGDPPRRIHDPEAVRVTPDTLYHCKLLAVSKNGGRGSEITRWRAQFRRKPRRSFRWVRRGKTEVFFSYWDANCSRICVLVSCRRPAGLRCAQ